MGLLQQTPKVTVLMSVFNGSQYLEEVIDSVLSQTFDDFEFLIIDDFSLDSSIEIIKSYDNTRIRLIENECNIGQTASLNKGLKLAKGEYIARIDQDDICMPYRLKNQVQFLNTTPNVAVLGSYFIHIDSDGNLLRYNKLPVNPNSNLFYIISGKNPLMHSVVMYRKNIIEEIGGYRGKYMPSEDIDLWLRLYQNGYISENIPEYLTKVRIHKMQTSKTEKSLQKYKHMLAFYSFYKSVSKKNINYYDIKQYFNVLVWRNEKVSLNNFLKILTIFLELYKNFSPPYKKGYNIFSKFQENRLFQIIGIINLISRSNIYSIMIAKFWNK